MKLLQLLQFLRRGIVDDQIFKEGENMLAVLHDPLKHRPQLRLANGFLIPLREYCRWNGYVPAQLLGGMAAQEQAVKKCGFALRELEFLQHVFDRVGRSRHGRKSQFTDFGVAVKRRSALKMQFAGLKLTDRRAAIAILCAW